MQKIFNAIEKLFFNNLIICLISFIYFIILPNNLTTITFGLIFSMIYLGSNFYIGYTSYLDIKESIIVGIMGCGIGLFLGFFAIYTNFILNRPDTALWIIMPYFYPTKSLIEIFYKEITLLYPFLLMCTNIFLVILGSIIRNIMNKLYHYLR